MGGGGAGMGVGLPRTTVVSIPHSFCPRMILKYPSMPLHNPRPSVRDGEDEGPARSVEERTSLGSTNSRLASSRCRHPCPTQWP